MKTAERLTDSAIRRLVSVPGKTVIHWDSDVKGFGLRVTAAGAKAFVLNYWTAGRERRITIGAYPSWSASAAREHARELKRRVDLGEDPMGDRHAERAAPFVSDLCDRFLSDFVPTKRPNTQDQYRRIVRLHVRPRLGKVKVADVRPADIDALHRSVSVRSPSMANRVVAVASKMFGLAVRWEMRADNPVKGVERNGEEKRSRYLTPPEIGYLSRVLNETHERVTANAVRLLLLTGARRAEVLSATWDQFDLDAGVWTKPSAHTKQKKEHRVPLSSPAVTLLKEMRQSVQPGAKFLFPGATAGKPLQGIKTFWGNAVRRASVLMWADQPDTPAGSTVYRLKAKLGRLPTFAEVAKAAPATLPPGLTDVRVHDLRHTYASILVSAGMSLPMIGALLGHTQSQTTARYAHLMDDPLRKATEAAASVITKHI